MYRFETYEHGQWKPQEEVRARTTVIRSVTQFGDLILSNARYAEAVRLVDMPTGNIIAVYPQDFHA